MASTFTRKRVEILVDRVLAHRLVEAGAKAGIAGHSLIPVESGSGRSGRWRDDMISGGQKVIFLTIAKAEVAEKFVDLLAPNLESWGMILTLSDVEVVRPERF